MIRQFNMTNANGVVFDLMRKDAFLHEPEGLGWGLEKTVMRAGDGYIVTDTQPLEPAPSGEMVFLGYAQYEEFLEFCQVGGLVLGYKTVGAWRYLDVGIEIDKTEIDYDSHRLLCPVDFTALSGWYEKLVAYQAQSSGGGKTYSYTYPYTYTGSAAGTVEIPNGNLASYPKITIYGPVDTPTWALYQGGTRLETGRVNLEVPTGHKLVVDANPSTMEIAEYTNDGVFVANRYADSDFTTARLFMLPAGPCSVVFTQEGAGVVSAFVEVRKRV